tara:strand:+ start:177 stop:635 length:459 start_codon:yes stop_codon:yes gene_type:complete
VGVDFTIIQLGEMHLDACIDLDVKSLKGLWSKSQWEKELTDPKRICLGIIDLETKKLLGFCSAWLVIDELHITSVAVHPIHRRKGLGKFLLSDLIKRSSSLGTNQIHLEVKETNNSAKAFYKFMGFKTIGKRSNFYKDGSDALLLTKEIKNN